MDDSVRRALEDLAEATRRAPPYLERAVLAAFDRQREQGFLRRCTAAVWTYRRETVAIVLAAGVATTIYFRVLDRAFVRSRAPERPAQSLSTRPAPPSVLERDDAQTGRPTPVAPVAHRTPRARPRAHRPVRSAVVQAPTWRASDDVVHSVRVRVSRTMLPLLGIPIIEPDAAGTVGVEILLGTDGLARTIRIVP